MAQERRRPRYLGTLIIVGVVVILVVIAVVVAFTVPAPHVAAAAAFGSPISSTAVG